MKTHRVLWLSVYVPLNATGAAVALVVSPAAAAFLSAVAALVAALLTMFVVDEYWERGMGGRLGLSAVGALVAGTSVGALFGYAALLGPSVLLLVVAVFVSSPAAVKAAGRWHGSVRSPTTARLDAAARSLPYATPESAQSRAPDLRALSDEQLCKRWRANYRASQRKQPSTEELIAAVAERQRFIDELERRNRSGFAAWLAAGPQAAEDPMPYFGWDRLDAPTVDWDELTRRHG
jgi:hypothetical protein